MFRFLDHPQGANRVFHDFRT